MARTLRKIPVLRFHRKMKHISYRKSEDSALTELKTVHEDFSPGIKINHVNRLMSSKSRIINPWDDYGVSALYEIPQNLANNPKKLKSRSSRLKHRNKKPVDVFNLSGENDSYWDFPQTA